MEDDSKVSQWFKKHSACLFKRIFKVVFILLTSFMCFLLYMEYVYEPPGTSIDEIISTAKDVDKNA